MPRTVLVQLQHTIGTAFILAHDHLISLPEGETQITFEEGVGVIDVTLSKVEYRFSWFR